jgi:hypothetical protein
MDNDELNPAARGDFNVVVGHNGYPELAIS